MSDLAKQASGELVVEQNEMTRFMRECLVSVGTDESHAAQLAEVLITGDYRGHYSHGLNRLGMYVDDVLANSCAKKGQPVVLKEKVSTAWVDGCNILGPVVGNFCMQLAISKAKQTGIGWVVAKGSNHYGIAGFYSMLALKEGLIGISMTNSSPLMVPTRSRQKAIGSNPISVAAPGAKDGDNFVLDMATTAVALGKVEIAARKEEPIPRGWAVNKQGVETTDPNDYDGLLPLGGTEAASGYKGYGLGAMVELFCGILAGGAFGPNIRNWLSRDKVANLGQCFVAIDPEAFAPGSADRMQSLMDNLRSLDLAKGENGPVLVAGDLERLHMQLCDKLGGVPYHANQIQFANDLAHRLSVEPPRLKPSK